MSTASCCDGFTLGCKFKLPSTDYRNTNIHYGKRSFVIKLNHCVKGSLKIETCLQRRKVIAKTLLSTRQNLNRFSIKIRIFALIYPPSHLFHKIHLKIVEYGAVLLLESYTKLLYDSNKFYWNHSLVQLISILKSQKVIQQKKNCFCWAVKGFSCENSFQ